MKSRFSILSAAPGVLPAMMGLENYLRTSPIEANLLHLVKLRASQINQCAYCIDMHWKDLRAAGETEQRCYGLNAWEESSYYTERERAALAWTEAVTRLTDGYVPDAVYEAVRPHFNDRELSDLTFAIAAINAWNRLNVAARTPGGLYQVPTNKAKHPS